MSETYRLIKSKVMGREHVLLRGSEPVGRFAFDGMFSNSAHASAGEQHWTFRRQGMMKPVITVRSADMLLTGRSCFSGSCDLVVNGTPFRFKQTKLWRGEYAWLRENGTPVIRYCGKSVEILADDLPDDTTRMLALLGGYLRVLAENDAAAIMIAVS
ncbi:MAG TPA: hypothetical protein VJZ00_01330 [Thermoanaerobaculia bacterium]|nr:hypothetical protein [Thermoanaerobaculia bacterium]